MHNSLLFELHVGEVRLAMIQTLWGARAPTRPLRGQTVRTSGCRAKSLLHQKSSVRVQDGPSRGLRGAHLAQADAARCLVSLRHRWQCRAASIESHRGPQGQPGAQEDMLPARTTREETVVALIRPLLTRLVAQYTRGMSRKLARPLRGQTERASGCRAKSLLHQKSSVRVQDGPSRGLRSAHSARADVSQPPAASPSQSTRLGTQKSALHAGHAQLGETFRLVSA